jgi:hypothetical protein
MCGVSEPVATSSQVEYFDLATSGVFWVAVRVRGTRTPGAPRWSPDGCSIAFDSVGATDADIFVVDAQSGGPRKLSDGAGIRPFWSRDDQWIYFGSGRSGINQIWKSPVSGGNARQVTREGGLESFESPDGETLYYTKGDVPTPGLWSMPVKGGPEIAIPLLSAVHAGYWAIADQGIYFVDFSGMPPKAPTPVRLFDFERRQISEKGVIPMIQLSTMGSFSVTRDGRWMAWMQVDRSESNLMLIENFR